MNEHILLVDDDASLRASLRACLETTGYLCSEVNDGYEAHVWLEKGHPVDLIVTDHQMPRVTGLELVKSLRNQQKTKVIPIIFYSGQLTDGLRSQAIQAGANLVLGKPFPLNEFLNFVTQFCGKS